MRLAPLGWAGLGLSVLGCPLLVDNRLQLVPAADPSGGAPSSNAGAPTSESPPARAGSPPASLAGAAGEGGAPGEGGGSAVACAVASTPEPGGACPASCDRCAEGYCIFECSDDEVCQERALACPAGWACRVSCSAQAACNKARIACPADFACEVECLEEDSCKEAVVSCATGSCHVRCDAEKACEKAKVSCSTGHCAAECLAPMHPPMLACGPACACEPC